MEKLTKKANGQWDLEKAKWVTPEQQKANKAKATANANKEAFSQANIAVDEKVKDKSEPAPELPASKSKAKLSIVKAESVRTSKNGQWSMT